MMKPTGSISTRTSNTKHSGMTKSFWQQWNLWIVSASSTQSLTGSISLCAVPVPNKNVAVLECTSLKWRPLRERMWSIIGTGISQLPAVCSEHSISGISKNRLSLQKHQLVYLYISRRKGEPRPPDKDPLYGKDPLFYQRFGFNRTKFLYPVRRDPVLGPIFSAFNGDFKLPQSIKPEYSEEIRCQHGHLFVKSNR